MKCVNVRLQKIKYTNFTKCVCLRKRIPTIFFDKSLYFEEVVEMKNVMQLGIQVSTNEWSGTHHIGYHPQPPEPGRIVEGLSLRFE